MITPEENLLGFSGHESFAFRHTWIWKGLNQVSKDPNFFHRKDALIDLGVGKNMVSSIRHWCLATQMVQEVRTSTNQRVEIHPTKLGAKVFLEDGWDPFLEDIGTLWLIHWLLSTNRRRATTWYFGFNEYNHPEFTKLGLFEAIKSSYQKFPTFRISENTLKRDVEIFIRTYFAKNDGKQFHEESMDCPLTELNLICDNPAGKSYDFIRGEQESLPDEVFVFSLYEYWSQRSRLRTLPFVQLCYDANAPGRVFKLDEPSMHKRLESVGKITRNRWRYAETSGLKELIIDDDIDPMNILGRYYVDRN
jgi:hypothetical protein